MLAITPLAINCWMMWSGLVAIRSASSRTVMLAGISMTLWPFSLMTSLRQGAAERGARSEDQTLIARLGADAGTRPALATLLIRQTVHIGGQRLPLIGGDLGFQGLSQRPAQARRPTRATIVQVGPAAGSLARGIDLYPVRTAHDPDQRSLRQHVPAPYAGPLRLPFRPPGRHAMSFLVRGFRPTRRRRACGAA